MQTASAVSSFENLDWGRQYFDLAGVMLVAIGPDGRVLRINRKGAEVLGYAEQDIVGKDWFESFIPAHIREGVREVFLQLMQEATNAPERFENPVLRKDGLERLIAWRNALLRDESGRVVAALASGEDITEQRRARFELHESEARFRATFEQAAVGMALIGLDGRFLRCNDKFCEITGYSRLQLQTRTIQSITHPDDVQAGRARREELLSGSISHYNVEKRYVREDGAVVWIDVTSSLVRDAMGQPDYSIAVIEDVTARKQAETLRANEELQRMALSAAQAGAWEWDAATGTQMWSPEMYRIFGLPPAKRPPNYHAWLVRCVHPDDHSLLEGALGRAMAESDFNIEFRSLHPQLGTRWVVAVGRVICDERRKPLRAYGISVDVTDRRRMEEALRQSEERLRLAMAAGKIGVWEWDIPSGRVSWSKNLSQLVGVDPGTFAITFDAFRALVVAEDWQQVDAALRQAMAGQADFNIAFRMMRPKGQIRWTAIRSVVMRDREGQPSRLIGIEMDITPLKEAEDRQRRFMEELDHRVRNVIGVIQAIARQTMADTPECNAFLGRLSALGNAHALLTVNQWKTVDLSDLVEKELAAYPADRVAMDGPAFAISPMAAQTFALVLHELATNAAKYGALSRSSGRVFVGWSIEGEDEPQLQLDWIERDGPPVAARGPSGFGTKIIRLCIGSDLRGKTTLDFLPEGLRARLSIPVKSIAPSASG